MVRNIKAKGPIPNLHYVYHFKELQKESHLSEKVADPEVKLAQLK